MHISARLPLFALPSLRVVAARVLTMSLLLVFATSTAWAEPSATASEGAPDAALQRLQSETGLTFTPPSELTQSVRPDGEVQFESSALFVAVQAMDGLDEAVSSTVQRLQGIDKTVKADDVRNLEEGGMRVRAASGPLEVDGRKTTWMVFAFSGGRKALRFVLLGEVGSTAARALVTSVRRAAP